MIIKPPTKVYVSKSKIHGWGVFASELIKEGEIIEETPLFDLQIPLGESTPLMIDYRFNWPQGNEPTHQVLAWGYGCLYNHSNTPNAYWRSNFENFTFEFIAHRDINPNEEILTYYGDMEYWNDGRTHTKVV